MRILLSQWLLIFSAFLLGTAGCSISNTRPNTEERTTGLGEIKLGPGGSITEGNVRAKCTEPAPEQYNYEVKNTLETALKLHSIEIGKLDENFSRNVQILSNNTQKGADLKSILFYICQTSTTRGFSENTTAQLMTQAISAWNSGK